jgi:septal ring-binding cell division protein DamX
MPGTLDDVAALRAAKEQEDMETFFAERARKAAAPAMADIGPVGKYLPLPPAATPAPAPAPSSASSSAAPKPATSAQPTSAASVSNVPVASSRSFALPLPKASSAGGFGNFDKW